jgi:hypothetical protein
MSERFGFQDAVDIAAGLACDAGFLASDLMFRGGVALKREDQEDRSGVTASSSGCEERALVRECLGHRRWTSSTLILSVERLPRGDRLRMIRPHSRQMRSLSSWPE